MLQLGDRNIVETVFLMLKILRRGKKDIVVVAQLLSRVQLFVTSWTVAMPRFSVLHHLPEFSQVHVRWVGDAIQPSRPRRPLLLLPSLFPSIRVFSNELALLIRWSNIGVSASASVLPMNIQHWFPLGLTSLISLQSEGLSKSLLQHHSYKASILWRSAFFMVQLSHPYMTDRKSVV